MRKFAPFDWYEPVRYSGVSRESEFQFLIISISLHDWTSASVVSPVWEVSSAYITSYAVPKGTPSFMMYFFVFFDMVHAIDVASRESAIGRVRMPPASGVMRSPSLCLATMRFSSLWSMTSHSFDTREPSMSVAHEYTRHSTSLI